MTTCACDLRKKRSLGAERERVRALRAKIDALRAHLKDARERRKRALALISQQCRAERLAVRERVIAMRRAAHEESKRLGAEERQGARAVCGAQQVGIHQRGAEAVFHARSERDAELKYQADLRRMERGNRARTRERPRSVAAERRSESDDEVRSNLPLELLGAFERIKRSITATPHMSRTEVFLLWAENHPSEIFESIEERTEIAIREYEAKERAASRALRRAPKRQQYESASEVPF